MVKLAVSTSTEVHGGKMPLQQKEPLSDGSVKVPVERETVVHMRQADRRCTRRQWLGVGIAFFILLVACGTLAGYYFKKHCDGCQLQELEEYRFHHTHRTDETKDRGWESGERGGHSGGGQKKDGSREGDDGSRSMGNRESNGVKNSRTKSPVGDKSGGRKGNDGSRRRTGHRHPDRQGGSKKHPGKTPPEGRASPGGDVDGHPRPKHHYPLP
ncbi:uncharacterized protein LOC110981163 isoform X2 [Acanthaster planci]|uniref:Uncharacterized protein LOC110981163 isoform X2 n=1 Tax=Acanthaster planci TaxID=133434 RepID=A0A8B7YRZ1_ACAPL|nr:uncharacterized protein LOC110981163 isoform X2 [Acanthaster planci]